LPPRDRVRCLETVAQEVGKHRYLRTDVLLERSVGEWLPIFHPPCRFPSVWFSFQDLLAVVNDIFARHKKSGNEIFLRLHRISGEMQRAEQLLAWSREPFVTHSTSNDPRCSTLLDRDAVESAFLIDLEDGDYHNLWYRCRCRSR